MTISIHDWAGYDRNQYFSGAFVLANTPNGQAVARITEFEGDHVYVEVHDQCIRIHIDEIIWDGLTPRRCVAMNRYLYFISPLGARTTRKPITRGNLGTVMIQSDGRRRLYSDTLPEPVIHAYLRGGVYADSAESAVYMVQRNDSAALTSSLGYIKVFSDRRNDDGDYMEHCSYRLYRDSVEIHRVTRRVDMSVYVQQNWEALNE